MAVFFNEDPNHYIHSRYLAGDTELTEDNLRDFIKSYGQTNITDFLVCVNASMPFYPSTKLKSSIDRYNEWEQDTIILDKYRTSIYKCVKLCRDAYSNGIDIFNIWIDEIRKNKINAWISIRMNDIHDTDDLNNFLPSDFYKSNYDKIRANYRKPLTHPEHALDYSYEEVRNHYLTLIEDALDHHDCDGIELDYQREPYCFAIGKEYEGLEIMNGFIEEAIKIIKKAEEKRGHKIMISARVPSTPRDATLLGLDVIEWINREYFDYITVSPHWSSVDSNMPIEMWKRLVKDKKTKINAGLEILIDAYNRRGRKYLNIDLESALGYSHAYTSIGADNIYLFNYMSLFEKMDEENRCDVFKRSNYDLLLKTIGDNEKTLLADRKVVVTFSDTWIPGEKSRKVLPLYIQNIDKNEPCAIKIYNGTIPKEKVVTIKVGFDKEKAKGDKVVLYFNCEPCALIGKADPIYPAYDDLDYYEYEVINNGNIPCISMLEIGTIEGEAIAHWIELEIKTK
ncbi:MAG: hypothetical protein MJ236_00640 [Clostridia bacterium]|nr:hypothetical protein [Clostridia bacterium]